MPVIGAALQRQRAVAFLRDFHQHAARLVGRGGDRHPQHLALPRGDVQHALGGGQRGKRRLSGAAALDRGAQVLGERQQPALARPAARQAWRRPRRSRRPTASYSVSTPAGIDAPVSLVMRIADSGCVSLPVARSSVSAGMLRSMIGTLAVWPAASDDRRGKLEDRLPPRLRRPAPVPRAGPSRSACGIGAGAGGAAMRGQRSAPRRRRRAAFCIGGSAGRARVSTLGRMRPRISTGTSGRCT